MISKRVGHLMAQLHGQTDLTIKIKGTLWHHWERLSPVMVLA